MRFTLQHTCTAYSAYTGSSQLQASMQKHILAQSRLQTNTCNNELD